MEWKKLSDNRKLTYPNFQESWHLQCTWKIRVIIKLSIENVTEKDDYVNPLIPDFLILTHPSADLDRSIVAYRDARQKHKQSRS